MDAYQRACVVEACWNEMARFGPTYDRNGDLTNPLAGRAHDDCWEQGDGDRVLEALQERLRNDLHLCSVVQRCDVQRYVPRALLDLARATLAAAVEQFERVTLADGAADQALIPGVAVVPETLRQISALQRARAARRACHAMPAGGLFDETAKAQQTLL